MKHLILLALTGIAFYVAWVMTPRKDRAVIRRIARKHVKPITAFLLVLFAGLVYAFYTRSISLL